MKLLFWLGFSVVVGCGGDTPQEPAPSPAPEPEAPPAQGVEAEPEDDGTAVSNEDGDVSEEGARPEGRWRRARRVRISVEDQLNALGYMDGTEPAPEMQGILRHTPEATYAGSNFYVSGHAPEAFLMSMTGEVLHKWHVPFDTAFPNVPEDPDDDIGQGYWRRGYLYENGDILAIYPNEGFVRVDKDSNVVWAKYMGAHHHIQVVDGNIYVLTRKLEESSTYNPRKPIWNDYVTIMSGDGEIVREVSILNALLSTEDPIKEGLPPKGDLLHTNSLQILGPGLDSVVPQFKEGNIMLSFRKLNAIAVLDMELEQITWSRTSSWRKQHDAFVLDADSLLLFDNNPEVAASTVLEFNPETMEEQWAYRGTDDDPFYSTSCGANQRLPNGNTLITESNVGRAFEVTTDGTIVWEFLSPHRAGDEDEWIATLLDVTRIGPDFDTSWAKAP